MAAENPGHYSVEIVSLSDPTCDVTFTIRPPVEFLTEQARQAFGQVVLHLANRRAEPSDRILEDGIVELTHQTADFSGTQGYAKIETLRYGSGKEVFYQALLAALNGEYGAYYDESGRAPWDPKSEQ